MQHQLHNRPASPKPVTIEIDGEPLGVVIPAGEGYRFLAVRLSAFDFEGQVFESVEAAHAVIGEALHTAQP